MNFNWREYLSLAIALKNGIYENSKEAASRTAISRAYYAAFCFARNYARDNYDFRPSNRSDDHRDLRDFYKRHNEVKVAGRLDDLRRWRNDCDYRDNISNISIMLDGAIKKAESVFKDLN